MPREYLDKSGRIIKFATALPTGKEVMVRDVVKAFGGRSISSKDVGYVFSCIPDVLEMVTVTNHITVWRRK